MQILFQRCLLAGGEYQACYVATSREAIRKSAEYGDNLRSHEFVWRAEEQMWDEFVRHPKRKIVQSGVFCLNDFCAIRLPELSDNFAIDRARSIAHRELAAFRRVVKAVHSEQEETDECRCETCEHDEAKPYPLQQPELDTPELDTPGLWEMREVTHQIRSSKRCWRTFDKVTGKQVGDARNADMSSLGSLTEAHNRIVESMCVRLEQLEAENKLLRYDSRFEDERRELGNGLWNPYRPFRWR